MRVEMPHPIPPLEYFSSEDAPLLSDYPQHGHLDVHHYPHNGDFEVATFPATPLLPDVTDAHDDDFSDFVQSPTSEVPPKLKGKEGVKAAASGRNLADIINLEYIQHVTILILVQVFIPIPFMIPMGINFAKRAAKVFLPGFALGFLGHTFVNILRALPDTKPFGPSSAYHLFKYIPDSSELLSTLWSQLKLVLLGGVVVGAVMAHILNFVILGHTVCRLARRLEPDPTVMRRAMDESKGYQSARPIMLDFITALLMVPAGNAARRRLWGTSPSNTEMTLWHSAVVGIVGVAVVHSLRLTRRWRSSPESAGRSSVHGTAQVENVSGKRKKRTRR